MIVRNKILLTVSAAIIVVLTSVCAFASPDAVVVDDAGLFTDEEKARLTEQLQSMSEYGSFGVITGYSEGKTTEMWAKELYDEHFGSASGSLFVIDMNNRIIQIFSRGTVYDVITVSNAEAITDNIYKMASAGKYYACASEAMRQEMTLLGGGKIAKPMKHITNALIAVSLAILINYIIVVRQRRQHKTAVGEVFAAMTVAGVTSAVLNTTLLRQRRYKPSSGGGSSSGGGGSFSGGGSFGGGSSGSGGGGGGHSF